MEEYYDGGWDALGGECERQGQRVGFTWGTTLTVAIAFGPRTCHQVISSQLQ